MLNYLNRSNCQSSSATAIPLFCSELSNLSRVVLVTYRKLKSDEIPLAMTTLSDFHIITPHDVTNRGGLNVLRYGIGSTSKSGTVDGEWRLDSLGHLLSTIFPDDSPVDLLLIDMDGGEFALFPELILLASRARFKQLAIRGSIWTEENENFRKVYWSLRQLQNYGYSMMIGRTDLPRYDAVFQRQ